MTQRTVENAAMQLSNRARERLAAKLISSLDEEDPAEIDRLWVEEAERRYRRYRITGIAKPAKQAIAEARAALHK